MIPTFDQFLRPILALAAKGPITPRRPQSGHPAIDPALPTLVSPARPRNVILPPGIIR
jgi:hypothetical protein